MKNIEILNGLQESFAVLLWAIIISDGVVSDKEREAFNKFFEQEFDLNPYEIDALFKTVETNQKDLEQHLKLLRLALRSYPIQKARFMQYLNQCIICDGVDDREYRTFEEIRQQLF